MGLGEQLHEARLLRHDIATAAFAPHFGAATERDAQLLGLVGELAKIAVARRHAGQTPSGKKDRVGTAWGMGGWPSMACKAQCEPTNSTGVQALKTDAARAQTLARAVVNTDMMG